MYYESNLFKFPKTKLQIHDVGIRMYLTMSIVDTIYCLTRINTLVLQILITLNQVILFYQKNFHVLFGSFCNFSFTSAFSSASFKFSFNLLSASESPLVRFQNLPNFLNSTESFNFLFIIIYTSLLIKENDSSIGLFGNRFF